MGVEASGFGGSGGGTASLGGTPGMDDRFSNFGAAGAGAAGSAGASTKVESHIHNFSSHGEKADTCPNSFHNLTGHVLRGVSDCPLCRPDCGGRSHVPSLAASSLAMAIGC